MCFQTTHWSVVLEASGDNSDQALETLCRAYWYPLFAYVRKRGYDEDTAKDLTQAFFERLLHNRDLAVAQQERGRFRTFLLTLLNHFLTNQWVKSRAQKRGGGFEFISLDYARDQSERSIEPSHTITAELLYEKRWAEAVLNRVLQRLRDEFDGTRIKRFDVLKPFLTDDPRTTHYAAVAEKLEMTEQAVKSAVHRLRQRYGEMLRYEIAQTVALSSDIDDELRHLIQVLSS